MDKIIIIIIIIILGIQNNKGSNKKLFHYLSLDSPGVRYRNYIYYIDDFTLPGWKGKQNKYIYIAEIKMSNSFYLLKFIKFNATINNWLKYSRLKFNKQK